MDSYKHGLDVLRFFLAFAVMLYHYLWYGPLKHLTNTEILAPDWMIYARFAVSVFFIISGYVITQSIQNRNGFEFLTARLSRLLPALVFCSAITYVLLVATNPGNWLVHGIEMLRAWSFFGLVLPGSLIDPSYWSLELEILFYLYVAIAIATGLIRFQLTLLLIWILSCFLLIAFLPETAMGYGAIKRYVLLEHSGFFILGILLAQPSYGSQGMRQALIIILVLILMGIQIHLNFKWIDLYVDGIRAPIWHSYIVVLASLGLFYLGLKSAVPVRFRKISKTLGQLSFPLYLIHQAAGYVVINQMSLITSYSLLAVLSAVIFSLIISFACIIWIEPVGRQLIKTLTTRLSQTV